ncbi:MAG: hypothetical protein H8E44_01570 [Planctomycetes bacterium]|nr:hypothetical protein [Planctomycetota bacterium]
MKWYWAILATLAIMIVVGWADVFLGGTGFVISGAVVLSAIWVAADSSSFGWGVLVLLFWILGFPGYLMIREVWSQEASATSEPHLQPEGDASAAAECVTCGSAIPAGMDACPACGSFRPWKRSSENG